MTKRLAPNRMFDALPWGKAFCDKCISRQMCATGMACPAYRHSLLENPRGKSKTNPDLSRVPTRKIYLQTEAVR